MSRPGDPSEEPLGGVSPGQPDAAEPDVDSASPGVPLGEISSYRPDTESGVADTSDDNASARVFALGHERNRADARFEDLVRKHNDRLHRCLEACATAMVGENDAAGAVNRAWEKLWKSNRYNPALGGLERYLLAIVRNECRNIIRKRAANELLAGDLTAEKESPLEVPASAVPDESKVEYEVEAKIVEALIDAASELILSPKYRAILRYECERYRGQPELPAGPPSATRRQQRLRLRKMVRIRAGVTTEEWKAVEAVNAHRAGDPALSREVRGLALSAERKVLASFGIETGDDHR